MERLKRQDEERKSRKKEEKDKKQKEREIAKQAELEKLRREQDEKDKIKEKERLEREEVQRQRKEKEQVERRKENFEKSIKNIWNGSDIQCLFDSKIAYSKTLYSFPVELEQKIARNEVTFEDLKFRRYKNLLIPIDGLLGQTSGRPLIELVEYFLRYSTVHSKTNEIHPSLPKFPFKLISMVETVAQPPFSQCSLSPV